MTAIDSPIIWHKLYYKAELTSELSFNFRHVDLKIDGETVRVSIYSQPVETGHPFNDSDYIYFTVENMFEFSTALRYEQKTRSRKRPLKPLVPRHEQRPHELVWPRLTYLGNDKDEIDHLLMMILLSAS